MANCLPLTRDVEMDEKLLCSIFSVINTTAVIATILCLHRVHLQHWRPAAKVHSRSAVQLGDDLVARRSERVASIDGVYGVALVARPVPHHQWYVCFVPFASTDVARQADRVTLNWLVFADSCREEEEEKGKGRQINNQVCRKKIYEKEKVREDWSSEVAMYACTSSSSSSFSLSLSVVGQLISAHSAPVQCKSWLGVIRVD